MLREYNDLPDNQLYPFVVFPKNQCLPRRKTDLTIHWDNYPNDLLFDYHHGPLGQQGAKGASSCCGRCNCRSRSTALPPGRREEQSPRRSAERARAWQKRKQQSFTPAFLLILFCLFICFPQLCNSVVVASPPQARTLIPYACSVQIMSFMEWS